MSKSSKLSLAITILVLTFATPHTFPHAWANAENLKCDSPFRKVRTFGNAIRCKAADDGLRSKEYAQRAALHLRQRAFCNAHSNHPKIKVWKKQGRWAYRVTFICAVIY